MKNNKPIKKRSQFLDDIISIITHSKIDAVKSVEYQRVLMYWKMGERILIEEQQEKDRADYGTYLLKSLEKDLEPEYGSGFSYRQLAYCRQFYRIYPNLDLIRSQFNWTQYRLLIQINDVDKREYYELETLNNSWNSRELERQISSSLYERLLLSNDKASVLAVARKVRIPQKPEEIIKDPMYLEFLGLEKRPVYYEKELEKAIIENLSHFLLELGNGFAFVARQKRILLNDDDFFIDLVFYNRLLKCFVLIEIKIDKIDNKDLGQLQMYVNYYDRKIKLPEENNTIGILLCADKNDLVVEYTLPEDNKTIMASKYELYLPNVKTMEEKLKNELKNMKEMANDGV